MPNQFVAERVLLFLARKRARNAVTAQYNGFQNMSMYIH